MKKSVKFFSFAALLVSALACNPKEDVKIFDIKVQLAYESAPKAVENVAIVLADAAGISYDGVTDATGTAAFKVPAGRYTATSAAFKEVVEGVVYTYSGSNNAVAVIDETTVSFRIGLNKLTKQQIIIKELYCGGCPSTVAGTSFTGDSYVVLYNNSEIEADATNIAIGILAPYGSNQSNKYYNSDNVLLYEKEDWVPAIGGIWSFNSTVKIAPYSQIVVSVFGAVDHTATYPASVNLGKAEYYAMVKNTQYNNKKYVVSDAIPAAHYLTCVPFTQGNAWALSVNSPAVFIMKATKEEVEAMSKNTEAFDHTLGTSAAHNVVKVKKSSIVDALEVWNGAKPVSESKYRLSPDLNSGYVMMTNVLGYSIYRNVDKAATEALPENAGKIVTGYKGGTVDLANGGTTDPSGIDAEASAKAGAHIIFSDTNNTGTDFHQRAVASIK